MSTIVEVVSEVLKNEWWSSAGISIFVAVIAAKGYDLLKNSNIHKALLELLKPSSSLNYVKAYLRTIDAIILGTIPKKWIYRTVALKVNSSLLSSISMISEEIVKASEESKKSKTIVGLMLGEKLKNSSKAQFFLVITFILNLGLSLFFELELNGFVFSVVGIGMLGMHIDHKLIEYRVKQGLYGTNSFEGREIINFITAHANKSDFNDSGGLKKIIPNPELKKEESKDHITDGVKI
ncbi:hypothetical protein AB4298_12750 [Shewanella sp. 10N.261.52.F9]|uniref:hypothetical protein n=1 Tax=Shewanella sp. 10N.261.52.F9 TaxID=3229684 RepID=UPI00354E3B9B